MQERTGNVISPKLASHQEHLDHGVDPREDKYYSHHCENGTNKESRCLVNNIKSETYKLKFIIRSSYKIYMRAKFRNFKIAQGRNRVVYLC